MFPKVIALTECSDIGLMSVGLFTLLRVLYLNHLMAMFFVFFSGIK